MKSDLVDLAVALHHETDKAVLVSTDGERKNAQWLPKSLIEIERRGAMVTVTMPEYLAVDRRLL